MEPKHSPLFIRAFLWSGVLGKGIAVVLVPVLGVIDMVYWVFWGLEHLLPINKDRRD